MQELCTFILVVMYMLLPARHACMLRQARLAKGLLCTASVLQPGNAIKHSIKQQECRWNVSNNSRMLATPSAPLTSHVSSSSHRFTSICRAASSHNHNSNPKTLFSRVLGLFHSFRAVCSTLFKVLVSLLLLITVTPYIISSKWGTDISSSIASRMLPGDVNIHRIQLGWTQPVVIEGLSVHESSAGSSRQLLSVPKLTSAEPLYSVISGKGLTFTISKPQIDCSLDDQGSQPRILSFIESSPTWRSTAAGSSGKGKQQQQQQQQQQQDVVQIPDSSSSTKRSPEAAAAAAAAAGGDKLRSHPILTRAVSLEEAAADSAAAAAAVLSPLRRRLTVADSAAKFSAEFMLPRISVYVPDGELLLPAEVRAAVGDHIHTVAAVGQQQVVDLAEELSEDATWIQQQQQQQRETSGSSVVDSSSGDGSAPKPTSAAAAVHWDIPPKGVSSSGWHHAQPVLLQVSGDHLNALLRGWRVPGGKFILQQPAAANWEFTPELARLTLSLYNPLIQDVAFVKEGGHLMTQYSPENGEIPATHAQVHISPMKFVMAQGQLLQQLFALLDMAQSSGLFNKRWSSSSSSSSSSSIDVWSGPTTVDIQGPGMYSTKRVDMMIGSGASAIHIALWGTVDATNDVINMRIGLPAATLSKIGIKNLPETYMLPLLVTGDVTKPQIEWAGAVRKLAVLSAMQIGARVLPGGAGMTNQRGVGDDESSVVGLRNHDQQQQQQGSGSLFPGWFGAANQAVTAMTSSFIGQVDQRLQQELLEVPPADELPWKTQEQTQQSKQQQQQEHK